MGEENGEDVRLALLSLPRSVAIVQSAIVTRERRDAVAEVEKDEGACRIENVGKRRRGERG
jgi:hypothetical protein